MICWTGAVVRPMTRSRSSTVCSLEGAPQVLLTAFS